MQRPGEPGAARFGPPEGCVDHRPHRYRSFMIEEILTEPPGPKGAAPAAAAAAAGELLKFGVQALLAARPFHNHLGTCGASGAGGWEGGDKTRRREDAPLGAWTPGGSLCARPESREAEAGRFENQASCPGRARPAGRVFVLSFPATLRPPAPRTEVGFPTRAKVYTANLRLRVRATSGRGCMGLRRKGLAGNGRGCLVLPSAGNPDLGEEPCISECCAGA